MFFAKKVEINSTFESPDPYGCPTKLRSASAQKGTLALIAEWTSGALLSQRRASGFIRMEVQAALTTIVVIGGCAVPDAQEQENWILALL